MDFTINLNQVSPEARASILKSVQHADRAQYALGVLEQIKMKKAMDALAVTGFNTDIGRTKSVISDQQWQLAMRTYGAKCFMDPDFSNWLLKHNEDMRVKDVGTRIQSGYTGKNFRQQGRSTADRLAHNQKAVGSTPTLAPKYSGLQQPADYV